MSLESKLLFSSDRKDFFALLGDPAHYGKCVEDCEKFYTLFWEARSSVVTNSTSRIFDLSTIFLSIRNIASCYSLGVTEHPIFSRNSAINLGRHSIRISSGVYQILERARILCTRGHGSVISTAEVDNVILELNEIDRWMDNLVKGAKDHERI